MRLRLRGGRLCVLRRGADRQALEAAAAALRRDGEARLHRLLASDVEGAFFDLSRPDGTGRIRIRGGRFQFASLGERAGPSATGNHRALFELIVTHSGRALLDLEFGVSSPPARGLLVVGPPNGRAFDHPGSEAETDFEHYSRFVHRAAARGLFDALREARLPAGVPSEWRLTRAAAPARGGATAASMRPGWRPAAGPAPLTRPLRGLAAFGPPLPLATLLGFAALGGLAALTSSRAGTIGFALVALGLALLVHARALFERRRRVEDVPTSRIRSAAIGPVEICGETAAL